MPTYEYKCEACDHRFERFQSIMADPIRKCPECGKNKVRRLIGTGAGLIFKGSGFYITDYRDAGYKEKAKAESGAPSGESKPSDAKAGENKAPSGDGSTASTNPAAESKPASDASSSAPSKGESKSSGSKKGKKH